jgi:protein phosphatase
VLIGLLVLIVLGGAAGGTYAYVHAQYYIGEDNGNVVIFRGVSGSIAGWSLHSVDAQTGIAVTDLPTFEQEKVQDGITASSKSAAAEIVTRLRNEVCTPTPATPCPRVTP